MKLIFDFDDVLFDAKKLKSLLFEELANVGVKNGEELYRMERDKGSLFSLKAFLHTALEGSQLSQCQIVYESLMKRCDLLVSKELLLIVQKIGKQNCYILTNGDKEFQQDKINRSSVSSSFQEVIIVSGSKKDVIHSLCEKYMDEDVLFVDDKRTFFKDIDINICKNLTTILYDENGLQSLQEKINEIEKKEYLLKN